MDILPPILGKALIFPDPRYAPNEEPAAIGGDLSMPRLLEAYRQSYFPWYSEGEPILWWSLNPRYVLPIADMHIGRTLRKLMRKNTFQFRYNRNFDTVIETCATIYREGEDGTWILPEVISAYKELNRAGYAVSLEVYQDGQLAGAAYGVLMGRVFCGESMFTRVPNAGKLALVYGLQFLHSLGIDYMDCQMESEHTTALGAREMDRNTLLTHLKSERKML